MPKLMILASEFPPGPGGIGTQAYQLSRYLSQMGWEVAVITSQNFAADEEIRCFNESQNFRIQRWPSNSILGPLIIPYRLCLISNYAKKWKPDAVLATGDTPVYLMAILSHFFNLTWVAVEHGRKPSSSLERCIKRWAISKADCVVAVSQYTCKQMKIMRTNPCRIEVIPNGADDSKFKILSDSELKIIRSKYPGTYFLLSVGQVSERKGHDIVIRALPYILKKMPDTHYFIAGLPTKQKEWAELSRKLGMEKFVHFLGMVEEKVLIQLFNVCDVFLMPSRHLSTGDFEGFGIAAVEAALCGKPAVVSKNSGLVEAIAEGATGISVPAEDAMAVAQAVITLLEDESLRKKMGKAARERALHEQTWEIRAKEYSDLLHHLLEASDPKRLCL